MWARSFSSDASVPPPQRSGWPEAWAIGGPKARSAARSGAEGSPAGNPSWESVVEGGGHSLPRRQPHQERPRNWTYRCSVRRTWRRSARWQNVTGWMPGGEVGQFEATPLHRAGAERGRRRGRQVGRRPGAERGAGQRDRRGPPSRESVPGRWLGTVSHGASRLQEGVAETWVAAEMGASETFLAPTREEGAQRTLPSSAAEHQRFRTAQTPDTWACCSAGGATVDG